MDEEEKGHGENGGFDKGPRDEVQCEQEADGAAEKGVGVEGHAKRVLADEHVEGGEICGGGVWRGGEWRAGPDHEAVIVVVLKAGAGLCAEGGEFGGGGLAGGEGFGFGGSEIGHGEMSLMAVGW